MPYIKPINRERLANGNPPEDPGDLNYAITKMCNDYLTLSGLSYDMLNEIVGVLECAKLEFYRRMAAPYEDRKIIINGDVYG